MPQTHRVRIACVIATILTGSFAWGAPQVELVVDGVRHHGKPIVHNDAVCWLADPSGLISRLDLDDVSTFRKLPGPFRAISPVDLAGKLRREFKTLEVQVRGRYVVCAPKGMATSYAELLDRVDRDFSAYFSRRNVKLIPPEFPLVALIYPSKEEFDSHCPDDSMVVSPLVKGYYNPTSNRISLFDSGSASSPPREAGVKTPRETAIHEAIHQLAFNYGLHSRVGETPRWTVEGLATMLEAGLTPNVKGDASTRVNQERLAWFREYAKSRRPQSLADFVAADEARFRSSPLDAYSEAWALTFFLAETRRPEYIQYLKLIAERDPLETTYGPAERLADFQKCFGKDLSWLETQFLRFINDLK